MRAYIALGSNLGDREQYLRDAIDGLSERVDHSSVWETDPVGGPDNQGAFLNMVVALETSKSPRELLELCQSLEQAAGRVRTEHWGPRTLDADVIMVGDLVVDEPDLVVPHPLWRERAFVVEPLREIAHAALAETLPALDLNGIRKAPSLWGDFDTSLRPADAARWFAAWEGPWAIAGGWAIELFVGAPVREHHDLDLAIARADATKLHDQLVGWELFFPAPGGFMRWRRDEPLPDDQHQVWGRPSPDGLWSLEILFEDIRGDRLHYRRAPSNSWPLDEAILRTDDGIPYIAPHVQLLYKTKGARPRDIEDFAAVAPLLMGEQRVRLEARLRGSAPETGSASA